MRSPCIRGSDFGPGILAVITAMLAKVAVGNAFSAADAALSA